MFAVNGITYEACNQTGKSESCMTSRYILVRIYVNYRKQG